MERKSIVAIEDWIYFDFDPGPERHCVTCMSCGKKNLEWGKVKGEWKLFKNGERHVCQLKMLKKDKDKVTKWITKC